MNRKDFIFQLWPTFFKPLLILSALYFCANFLYAVISTDGGERSFVFTMLIIALIIVISYMIIHFFNTILSFLKIPKSVGKWVKPFIKVLHYIILLFSLLIIYFSWIEDWFGTAILLTILLITSDRFKDSIEKFK